MLELENLSGDSADARLADGLTAEITSRLGRVPALRVKSRSAVRQLRTAAVSDPVAIGRALQVRYAVEGSVRRSGERVRVAVRLLKTEDGFQLWGDDDDVRVTDLLALQDTIARQMVDNIRTAASGRR